MRQRMIEVRFGATKIRLADSRAFGDGSHETTRLSLEALNALAPRDREDWRLLDFGSGSGILAIAAAMRGATAIGVEIDEAALEVSTHNAQLNEVAARTSFVRSLDDAPGPFDLVIANILSGVLVAFADALVARMATNGALVLCGLVATDGPVVIAKYRPLLDGRRPEIYERGEWRALVWRAPPQVPGTNTTSTRALRSRR
jgi:ribosomal protein L11 methyltransferase